MKGSNGKHTAMKCSNGKMITTFQILQTLSWSLSYFLCRRSEIHILSKIQECFICKLMAFTLLATENWLWQFDSGTNNKIETLYIWKKWIKEIDNQQSFTVKKTHCKIEYCAIRPYLIKILKLLWFSVAAWYKSPYEEEWELCVSLQV